MAAALLVGACSGEDGRDGRDGIDGQNGADGQDGVGVLDPNLPPLDKAVQALGGATAVRALDRLQYKASGQQFHQGQSVEPLGESRPVGTFAYTSSTDFANDLIRLDYTRDVEYPFTADLAYSYIIRGNLGVISGAENLLDTFAAPPPPRPMSSARWAALRKQHVLLHPELIVRYAIDNPGKVADAGITVVDGSLHDVMTVDLAERYAGMGRVSVAINHQTGAITKVSATENDHLLRDVEVEALFGAPAAASGVRIARTAALSVAGELVFTESRSDIAGNPTLDANTFAFPAGVTPTFDAGDAARAADSHQWHEQFQSLALSVLDPEQLAVESMMIAPGVFRLTGVGPTGAIHNSLVVEQSAGVVVVEAPLYPERADAIIAWVKSNIPGKPISHVVATHHHADHAGGLRSFVAEGATIVADQRAADLYLRVFSAPSSVRPDTLANDPDRSSPKMLLVGLDNKVRLDDAARPIDVFHLPTEHASDMVLISVPGSVPGDSVVFQSDLYSPGFPFDPVHGRELRDRIVALGLEASIMPGGHGGVSSLAELEQLLQPPAP